MIKVEDGTRRIANAKPFLAWHLVPNAHGDTENKFLLKSRTPSVYLSGGPFIDQIGFADSFRYVLGNLSIFPFYTLTWFWQGYKESKNIASENHFNQTALCGDSGWHWRPLYLIRALPAVIGRNTQSGFYWITPAQYQRGFTVIEQLYSRWGDSQMVLIKLRANSYYMPLLQF